MGLRFRRSLKLAPGLRLNFSKSGLSLSAGVRGARITAGRRGVYANVGLPGTGIYARERLDGQHVSAGRRRSSSGAARPTGSALDVHLTLHDDGTLALTDDAGRPLPAAVERRARREEREGIESWLAKQCDRWNQGIREILDLHLATPAPDPPATFQRRPFESPEPARPDPERPALLDRLLRSRRERLAARNREAARAYERKHQDWERKRAEHRRAETERADRFARAQGGEPKAMDSVLHGRLAALDWPRETRVSFQVDAERRVWMDVDLPEIENLPADEARVSKRGLRVLVHHKSDTQLREEYMRHVHAVGFRLAGEVFHLLPKAPEVVISGYSQRPDPATARVRDEYLYSAKISARAWRAIDFTNLEALDLPACFARFELRRKMTKTGMFKPIDPFRPEGP